MRIKAAIFRAPNQPLTVEEVEIDEPGPHEVLVRTVASGVCHSDLHCVHGSLPTRTPAILGHEPAGVVEAVGSGVTSVKAGDHVIACTSIYCGNCVQCLCGRPYLCVNRAACQRARSEKPRRQVHPEGSYYLLRAALRPGNSSPRPQAIGERQGNDNPTAGWIAG
jgi:S-(hydroxymethyl)glutathione dehydrogenase / alcohol dehydrogenase